MTASISTSSIHPDHRPINNLLVVPLTPAEIKVVDALSTHLCTNPQLSLIIGLKVDTIKHHLYSVMKKTGTFTRLELVVKWRTKEFQDWLIERGIIRKEFENEI